jgi:hypothetical protein
MINLKMKKVLSNCCFLNQVYVDILQELLKLNEEIRAK